jgi:hypothetical protein
VAAFAISLLRGEPQPRCGWPTSASVPGAAAIFTHSSVADLTFFHPSGVISDRFGRGAVLAPEDIGSRNPPYSPLGPQGYTSLLERLKSYEDEFTQANPNIWKE